MFMITNRIDNLLYFICLPLYYFFQLVNQKRNTILIISTILFLFTLTPFIFADFVSSNFRTSVFFVSTFILAISTKRFTTEHTILIGVVSIWVIVTLIWEEGDYFYEKLHQTITVSSIYCWSIFLYRALEFSSSSRALLIRYYKFLTEGLAIFSLLSLAYYLLLGSYFFSLTIEGNYDYILTPFGVMLTKNFFGMEVFRVFNYFSEPVYASVLFVGSFFIVQEKKGKYNTYRIITLFAGILLFSFAFYLLFFYFYFATRGKKNHIGISILVISVIVILVQGTEFMNASSMSERAMLLQTFLNEVTTWDGYQWMFGTSNLAEQDIHFSAGILQIIWDYGFIGLMLYSYIIYLISFKNPLLIGAMFIASLIINPYICPIYYFMIAIFGVILKSKKNGDLSII